MAGSTLQNPTLPNQIGLSPVRLAAHRSGSSQLANCALPVSPITGTTMNDRWVSVSEIATYLGVSKDTIYTWIAAKGTPAHRVGRLWKFRREEVDAWVKSGGASDRPAHQGKGKE